ncbi:type II toxin-antitoxin system VapC family toxin [Nostoc sp. CHAB 5784]|uniref:type II toxin-antitoxin system VapC family toxin n=1 Tax=Nostoc mirabile TaxID=2907820 RepID=UPI001E510151|nr:type II toxin-antitoxin system VapC family toxin [Nostoc mirabile]MCC5664403.1 type II toxin-antitoxin system VapC family toxin [Nostoc mirabile CHAB5784]
MTNYLLDTNIIIRFTDTNSPEYDLINNAISQILVEGGQCFITSQVITEFWVVATRPITVNGLGWTVEKTEQAVQMLINQFDLLEETPAIFPQWLSLVTSHKILGKRAHDLRIQAVMLAHNTSHILTLNPQDFVAIEGLIIIHPNSLNS